MGGPQHATDRQPTRSRPYIDRQNRETLESGAQTKAHAYSKYAPDRVLSWSFQPGFFFPFSLSFSLPL